MAERKRELTVSFRPSKEQKIAIEKRAELSGLTKNNYIIRSCMYNRIVVVGKKENIKKLIDELQEMNNVMTEIAGQIMSGNFILEGESFNEMKEEYLALVRTIVDYINGAEYLFDTKSDC
jgi:hypothetical protein